MPSVVISPTVQLRPVCRLCAFWLGRKPRVSTASSTRCRVSGRIRPAPFSAFDAVPTLTPASAATSVSLARPAEGEREAEVTGGPFPPRRRGVGADVLIGDSSSPRTA